MNAERDDNEPHTSAYETDGEASEASVNSAILHRRRQATVYDAVAGRVKTKEPKDRDRSRSPIIKHSTKDLPLAPEEVLFRRKGAPQRYDEHDIYFSHQRDLPKGGRGVLPDSDLLKAIHSYSSQYYSAQKRGQDRTVDERSMDETALLAFGILVEEAGREVLGRRGDLVFTEAAEPEDVSKEDEDSSSGIAIGYETSGTDLAHRHKRVKAEKKPVDG